MVNTQPDTSLPSPNVAGSEVKLYDAIVDANPPIAIYAPASIASRKIVLKLPPALLIDESDTLSRISFDVNAFNSTISLYY